jgi:hypothetical protein
MVHVRLMPNEPLLQRSAHVAPLVCPSPQKPPSIWGALPSTKPKTKIEWGPFFWQVEAPTKLPTTLVLPITPTTSHRSNNPLGLRIFGSVSGSLSFVWSGALWWRLCSCYFNGLSDDCWWVLTPWAWLPFHIPSLSQWRRMSRRRQRHLRLGLSSLCHVAHPVTAASATITQCSTLIEGGGNPLLSATAGKRLFRAISVFWHKSPDRDNVGGGGTCTAIFCCA